MSIVTYLLGAGASCQCLPTYANFGRRFQFFKNFIKGYQDELYPERQILGSILTACDRLELEFVYHATPDTVAKKYFHLGKSSLSDLNELKKLLILYFVFEQSVSSDFIQNTYLKDERKAAVDKRYDSFIAAILEPNFGTLKLKSNVKVLTWNYDLQFELCFQNYFKKTYIEAQKAIQSIPYIKNTSIEKTFDSKKFTIIHLNGIAHPQSINSKNPLFTQQHTDGLNLVKHLIEIYKSMSLSNNNKSKSQLLNFAWERDSSYPLQNENLNFVLDSAMSIVQKTDILVVIGYSFPIFNRPIDTQLFKNLHNINKIFIQSPVSIEIKETIINAFGPLNDRIIRGNIIHTINGLDYFHLPHEL